MLSNECLTVLEQETTDTLTIVNTATTLPVVNRGVRSLSAPLEIAASGNRAVAYRLAKRVLDLVVGFALLVVFSPLMLVITLVLLAIYRSNPLFCQQRVGRCGRTFTMFKFRTMHVDAQQRQHAVANEMDGPVFKNRRDPRITPIGRILRSSSMDELPQLLNVLAGHMSLVGPRPPILSEVMQYEAWQQQRLAVKPGLTCLWQVSGRNEIGFEDWVRMDLWYIAHQSLLLDLKLLLLTPISVLSRRGAY